MADLGTLIARLTLDTAGFSKGLDAAMGKIDGLVRMAAVVETALVGTFAAAAAEGLRFASELEQLDIAFTTFLGSAEASGAFLEQMKQFAAQTPFQFEDVTKGAQKLMALGFAAEETIPVLSAIGDRMSSLGAGAADINRTIRALGQMKGRGMVVTQEMNQLTEVGIKAWDILAKEVGVSTSEIRGMVEARMIDSSTFLKAFMHSTADEVGGMMEKQSKTLTGMVSTLKDNVSMELADAFTPLRDALKPLVKSVGEALPTVLAAFAPFIALLGDMAGAIAYLIDLFNALPAPAQKVLTGIVATMTLVTAGFATAILALGGFGFAIAAVTSAVVALDAALMPVLAVMALLAGAAATLLPPVLAIVAGVALLATEAIALSYLLPAAFNAAVPGVQAIATEIGNVIAVFVRTLAFSEAVTMAFLTLNRLWAVTVVVLEGLKAKLVGFWEGFLEATERANAVVPAFFQSISTFANAFFHGVLEGGIEVWNRFVEAIQTADGVLGDMRDTAVIFGQTFLEAFSAGSILGALQAIWKGFSALIQNAMGALLKMVVALQPFFEAAGMGDVGRQAMSGIMNAQVAIGIMSEDMAASVRGAMDELASEILFVVDGIRQSFSDYGDEFDGEDEDEDKDDPKKSGGAAKSKENPYIVAIEDINERLAKSVPKAEEAVEAPEKVLKTLSQFDKLDPIARQAAENAEAALQATKDFYGGLVDKLYAGLGKTGATISNAMEGLEQGGVWGALAAVIVDLLAESETMAAITSTLDEAFGRISNAFGKLLGGIHIIVGNALLLVAQLAEGLMPVFEWLSGIFGRLGAVFIPLGYIIQAIVSVIDLAMAPLQAAAPILDRAFEILYTVFQAVAVIILGVVYAIQTVWNFLLQGVINVLSGLATIFEGLEDTIDSLEAMKADTSATSDAINELTSTSYAEALAMAETAVAADETTEALDSMTASLVNVPAGYKVALARFAAIAAGNPMYNNNLIPAMASGGVVLGPTLALVGEKGPEAVVPLDRMGNMGGGPPIIIQNLTVMTDDPEALVAGIERLARRKAFQKTGNSMALHAPFATGRR